MQNILDFEVMAVRDTKLPIAFVERIYYLVSFSHFRGFSVCKSVSVSDFGLVQIISRLESQSSRCLHYFAALYRRTKEVALGSAIFRGTF